MGELTCTFTGHRAEKLPWGYNENDPRCRRLKQTLYDTLTGIQYGRLPDENHWVMKI